MSDANAHREWEHYRERELARASQVLLARGYALNVEQPHTKGERYLMQAVTTTSGRKLILLGTRTNDGAKVVIKVSSDQSGIAELKHEERCRNTLHTLQFAYEAFNTPQELDHFDDDELYVSITAFISQESSFLERPLETQFMFALRSFKAQEGARASAHSHLKQIAHVFDRYDANTYLRLYQSFVESITAKQDAPDQHRAILKRGADMLTGNNVTLARYADFLTHTDFVPHNFRIKDSTLYLLDLSSIRFGNKYEGWARFANFMALYEPPLLSALETYLHNNRNKEEYLSFRLMRIFRLGEIIRYYVRAVEQSEGDLQVLNRARVSLWFAVLDAVLNERELDDGVRQSYISLRDRLRSADERKRQEGLH